ncbi:hypothetical protein LCGC14_0552320 [marine sediment metagenome]|uniref:Rubredoxin-like domain-containing protein n=1 Tax=marine sediment metagenome TaxID=412755 RepID=A0A0F9RUK3_9ZZZZ
MCPETTGDAGVAWPHDLTTGDYHDKSRSMKKLITNLGKLLKCLRCGFTWLPRTESPKRCPKCKSYDWAQRKEKTT